MLITTPVKSGSAHSVIKHLPLLDSVSDNSRVLTFVPAFSSQRASLNLRPQCNPAIFLSEFFPDVQKF
jgi:hypothetical protein